MIKPVETYGVVHQGLGEFEDLEYLKDNRYLLRYNIDGASWLYEAEFDETKLVNENCPSNLRTRARSPKEYSKSAQYDADT